MDKKYELLMTVSESLNYLIAKSDEISEGFASGLEAEASNAVTAFIDDLSVTVKAIELTQDVQKEKIDPSEINDQLNAIIEAFENNDFILIGDLFQYELSPILKQWNEKVSLSTMN